MGVSGMGVNWFSSYLSNRKQQIGLNKVMSKPGHINCGVPQGSKLGPLLFLCYVNDMSISIDSECKLTCGRQCYSFFAQRPKCYFRITWERA